MKGIWRKLAALAAAALLTAGLPVGSLAWLAQATPPVANRFSAAGNPGVTVTESFDGTVKSNVAARNTGDMAGYIRCAVVVYLLDEDGNAAPEPAIPGQDYSIAYTGSWAAGGDGYWYYPQPVAPGTSTAALIDTCEKLTGDYGLSVTVLAQLVPCPWAEAAWGVTRDADGNIHK